MQVLAINKDCVVGEDLGNLLPAVIKTINDIILEVHQIAQLLIKLLLVIAVVHEYSIYTFF